MTAINTEGLADLLARVEGASGPDRALDKAILMALGQWAPVMTNQPWTVARLTASLDAALALTERVLPGWTIAGIGQDDSKLWHVELREGHQTSYRRVVLSHMTLRGSPTPALALLAALLKALIQCA